MILRKKAMTLDSCVEDDMPATLEKERPSHWRNWFCSDMSIMLASRRVRPLVSAGLQMV
jgi:hypothetical protein